MTDDIPDLDRAFRWPHEPVAKPYAGKTSPPPADSNFSINLPGVLEDVDLAMRAAGLATNAWSSRNRAMLDACTEIDRESLRLRFALTYLLSNGLAVVSPAGAYERFLAVDLEEPFASVVQGWLSEAVRRREAFARAAARR